MISAAPSHDGSLSRSALSILQVSTSDQGGGAEAIARRLHDGLLACGHRSTLMVGKKHGDDPGVVRLDHDRYRSGWTRAWFRVGSLITPHIGRVRGAKFLRRMAVHWVAAPVRKLHRIAGHEDFEYPGTWHLLEQSDPPPQIVHCHNLHGGYFDLRAVPWLSRKVPVVLTLHDAWLLSGHCAHSFECDRWRTGCGKCPDLSIPPSISRDGTAFNWRRKRAIYAGCRLYVASPSHWLMDKVEQSMLAPGTVERRVIPNGVDLETFRPHDRRAARMELNLPQDARILLFAAYGIRDNPWKDFRTLRAAIARIAERMKDREIIFLALGEAANPEWVGKSEVRFIPFQRHTGLVARYFQAADLYLHAAHADTFPNTVVEALACGTPVVATAVGGIPEQILGPVVSATADATALRDAVFGGSTGILVPPKDAAAMAEAALALLQDDRMRQDAGHNAARDARNRFDLNKQIRAYLAWYEEILAENNPGRAH